MFSNINPLLFRGKDLGSKYLSDNGNGDHTLRRDQ